MSATAANRDIPGIYHKAGSLRASGAGRCGLLYLTDHRLHHFLAPPVTAVDQPEVNAEISDLTLNPYDPLADTGELRGDPRQPIFIRFFINSAIVTTCVVVLTMVISVAAFAGAHALLGQPGAGDRRSHLPGAGHAAVHPLYQIVGGLGLLNSVWG